MTTAKHRERARVWLHGPLNGNPAAIRACEESLAKLIAAAHAEGRKEMREEAAKILAQHLPGNFGGGKPYTIAELITAIRSLPKDTGVRP